MTSLEISCPLESVDGTENCKIYKKGHEQETYFLLLLEPFLQTHLCYLYLVVPPVPSVQLKEQKRINKHH